MPLVKIKDKFQVTGYSLYFNWLTWPNSSLLLCVTAIDFYGTNLIKNK